MHDEHVLTDDDDGVTHFSYDEETSAALSEVRRAIRQACRDTQMASLNGEHYEESPYTVLIRDLGYLKAAIDTAVEHVEWLKTHGCEDDGNDYCTHCRADLRA